MVCQVVAIHRQQSDNLLGRDVSLHRFDPDHSSLGLLISVTLEGKVTDVSSANMKKEARKSGRELAWVKATCKEVLSAIISRVEQSSLTLFSLFEVH